MYTMGRQGPEPEYAPLVASTVQVVPSYQTQVVTIDGEDDFNDGLLVPLAEEEEATPLIILSESIAQVNLEPSEPREPSFQDVPWAILFLIHLAVVIYVGIFISPHGYESLDMNFTHWREEIEEQTDDLTPQDLQEFQDFVELVNSYLQVYPKRILLYSVLPSAVLAFKFVLLTTVLVMKPRTEFLVTSALACSLAIPAMFLLCGVIFNPGVGSILFAFIVIGSILYFLRLVWPMIPFASVNLKIALEGISANSGTYLVAFLFSEIGFCWGLYWCYMAFGVLHYENDICEAKHPQDFADSQIQPHDCGPQGWTFFALLISLCWTSTIILNTVQVIVVGVMATWCFDHEAANTCCSSAVGGSVYRSLTYSFGSICFGSFLQGFVTAIRVVINDAKNRRDNNDGCVGCGAICFCVLECVAKILEDVLDYFNQWSYVFVGIYGFSYLESGKRVMELFRAKGWISIITDNLVTYVLGIVSFGNGILTGFAVLGMERWATAANPDTGYDSFVYGPLPGWQIYAFIIGFTIGVVVSSVMMNVIKGAVNTLIVCWADSPSRMEENHPKLMKELHVAWSSVFPESEMHFTSGDAGQAANFGTQAVLLR